MTRILVIGGAGYIGSHTCKALKAEGFDPVVFDNLSEGHRAFVQWGDLIEGDIRDRDAVTRAVETARPDAIIHFAALAYVGESVEEPAKYYDNNVSGALNIADVARRCGNIPIVFSSTCATYGIPPSPSIPEETVQAPINPYGRTKLIVENILKDFDTAYGLRSICLRYFNACGADASACIGEDHRIETHLIPRAIWAALGIIDDFKVFGDDYDTPDGSAVRDYIHVTDLAQAHIQACRHLLDGGASDQFNIGTGKGVSVFEIIDAVEKATGTAVPYQLAPRRAGDPPVLIAQNDKARRVLGFEPEHSSLANIMATAVAWHRVHDLKA